VDGVEALAAILHPVVCATKCATTTCVVGGK
jgi:hypothetical protein